MKANQLTPHSIDISKDLLLSVKVRRRLWSVVKSNALERKRDESKKNYEEQYSALAEKKKE